MNCRDYVLRIGNGFGHVVSGALALDAINNAAHGHYVSAAFEVLFAAYIQISKKLERDQEKGEHNSLQFSNDLLANLSQSLGSIHPEVVPVFTSNQSSYSLEGIIGPPNRNLYFVGASFPKKF